MSDQGDTGYADQLASRIDVGDPDPKKEILRFLRVPYHLSERVLKLARDNQAFHVLGVVIARQALRLVLLLNAEVSRDGPTRGQLDERIKLQDQIVGLEAILRECGSYSDRNLLEDSTSKGKQQQGLATFDDNQEQEPKFFSQELRSQVEYQQHVSRIKKQYNLFFPPSPTREENFNILLINDRKPISFEAWELSRGLEKVTNDGGSLQMHPSTPELIDTENVTPGLKEAARRGKQDENKGSYIQDARMPIVSFGGGGGDGDPSFGGSTGSRAPSYPTMRHNPTNTQRLATVIQQHKYQQYCHWTPSSRSENGRMWHQAAFTYAGYTVLPPTGGWHESMPAAREETAFYALPCLLAHLTPARR